MTEGELRDAAESFAIAWSVDRRGGYAPAGEREWPKLLEAIASYVRVTGGGAFIQLGDLELLLAKAALLDLVLTALSRVHSDPGEALWRIDLVDSTDEYEAINGAFAALNKLEAKHGCCAVDAMLELEAKYGK